MSELKAVINRNASPSAYGWCFQVGAGISLMLDYVKDFSSIKMEGMSDDIELTLGKRRKIYAQAKSVTQIGDQRSAAKNLSDAMTVLSEDNQNDDAFKLIYITNIANPLSSKHSSAFQYGHSYDFSILPTIDQNKITKKAGVDFSSDKFQLQIIRFFGEGKDKFQGIKEKIEEFLRSTIDNSSYSSLLLDNWFTTFMVNATDKPDKKKKLNLTKKQIIYPLIAVIIDPPINDIEFSKVCDYENYNEVKQEFKRIIDGNICDYEFIGQVLGDYYDKCTTITDKTNYKYEFTRSEWHNYENEFSYISNNEKRQALIKILLLTIITQYNTINDIKKKVNL